MTIITVPEGLAAAHEGHSGAAGRAWIAALPQLAATMLERWSLTPTVTAATPTRHGAIALVLPVSRADGTPAALKLQPVDDETTGEPAALRAWHGNGAVRLLDHDPPSGTMLLEALDATRTLDHVPHLPEALGLLTGVLRRLHAAPPPPGLRHLRDKAASLLSRAPAAAAHLADPEERRLLADWAAALREVAGEPGGALLHWDLHCQNVLAPPPEARAAGREPWLAIDPKPLLGDPGFDLMPALFNRFVPDPADVLRRFDLMTDLLALDRPRAARWTLARALGDAVWRVEHGGTTLLADRRLIAETLRHHRS